MAKQSFLRRYTELAPLLYLLQKQALTLLSPRSWDDRNDAHFLETYKQQGGFASVLALCFTEAPETYHHWRVFAGGSSGVCLEFDKKLLVASMTPKAGITHDRVEYKTIDELRKVLRASVDLRFVKRNPFRDEKEFRIIYVDPTTSLEAKDVSFDRSALQRVVVNPWMPKSVYESVRDLIVGLDDWKHLKVHRTTLVDNEEWRLLARGGHSPSNKALQRASRAQRKAKSQRPGRAVRRAAPEVV